MPASGAILIDFSPGTLSAQGTGHVDVFITGELGDTLGAFDYEFSITGATAQSGDLQFRAVQSNSEQTESGPSPYVFFNDADPSFFNSVRGSNAVTLRGGDSLASLNDTPVNGRFLLARLELEHTGSLLAATHDFTITLNSNSPFTFFDQDFDPSNNTNYATFGASPGTVTVNATAVPEPSGMALAGILAIGGYLSRCRLRRKQVVDVDRVGAAS